MQRRAFTALHFRAARSKKQKGVLPMAAQPKTLAVVTGTRAEYGLLRPVIQKLLK